MRSLVQYLVDHETTYIIASTQLCRNDLTPEVASKTLNWFKGV